MVSDFSVASTQKGVFTLKAASTCGASTASAPSPFLIDSGTRLGSLKLQETGGLGDLWSVAQKTHERTLARPEGTSAQSVWNDRWNVRKISAPSTQPREISLTKTDVTQSSCPSDPPSLSLSPASQAQTEMERWFKTDNDSRSSNKPTDVQSTCRSDLPPFSEAEIQQIQMASWFKSYNDRPDKSDACTASSPIAGPDITDIESGKKSVRFQGPETSEFDEKGWTSSNDVTNPGSTGSGDSSSSYCMLIQSCHTLRIRPKRSCYDIH